MSSGERVDALHAELLRRGDSARGLREVLARHEPDEAVLVELLRSAVPVRLLEHLAQTPPWSDRPLVLAAVVLSPKAPRSLALRLLSSLYWRSLVEVAQSPRVDAAARARAEGLLKERLPELRLGEKVTLGRIATPPVLALLLLDSEPKVIAACLQNPRLREADLLVALRGDTVGRALIEGVASSPAWSERYAVRLELALQPRTPLPIALSQLSALIERDLRRVAQSPGLVPLVQIAALRLAEAGRGRGRTPRGSGR